MMHEILIKPKISHSYFIEVYYEFDYMIFELNKIFISIFEFEMYIKQFTGYCFAIGESI